MVSDLSYSNLRLEADTQTVEELVAQVRRGVVRIPSFQRGLKWEADDVIALFDSVYRGYPIGSFLLRKGRADAARLPFGPLVIDAPETHSALWVVDGQQRLTALTVGLARPTPVPAMPTDPWVIYFDAEEQRFQAPPKSAELPDTWVPVANLLDASALSEWVFNWVHGRDPALRSVVFQAGARIRQYQIPLYVVETNDEELLRRIFYRINNSGKPLKWDEIHDALFGRAGGHPSTLGDLAQELQQLGMGRPEEEQLLACLLSYKGLDVTRNVSEHYRRDQEVLRNAVRDALPAIRRVLSFLKIHGEIPHLRLLPRSLPLVVLTRFFALYPEPKSRTLDLLVRWTWRTLLNAMYYDERTLLRHGVLAISEDDEEGSVQQLLSLVPHEQRGFFELPQRFDARAADTRISLVAMASLGPLSIEHRAPIDVAQMIEELDVAAFRKIIPSDDVTARSPANRILLPGSGTARRELISLAASDGVNSQVLRSHAISPTAAEALLRGDAEAFYEDRMTSLEVAVQKLGERLAEWGRSDRPSIGYLVQSVEGNQ